MGRETLLDQNIASSVPNGAYLWGVINSSDFRFTKQTLLGGLTSGFQGSLAIADTPSADGFYLAEETGTYTNAGGLVVDLSNTLTFINVSDTQTVFDKIEIPIPDDNYQKVTSLANLDALIGAATSGTYLVTNNFTLDANKTLPSGVTLEFRGGVINGGGFTLTGDNTKINAEPKQIFTNITLGGTYNTKGYPQWFGATADGTTDDTTAVNAALSNLKDIYFADGTYIVQNVQTSSNQKIELSKNATLKLKAGTLGSSQMFLINGQTNVDISGGTFDGNVSNMAGESVTCLKIAGNSSQINIHSINFVNQCDRVIDFTASTDTITDINIYNCYYDGNGATAEAFLGANNSARTGTIKRVNVMYNIIRDAHSGIRFFGCDDVLAIGNQINVSRTTATECIKFQNGCNNVILDANILTTETQDPFGISIAFEDTACKNISITNNQIIGPGTLDTFTSEAVELVVRETGTVDGLVITDNIIRGEYYGITLGITASVSGTMGYNNVLIENNDIESTKRCVATIINGSTDATYFTNVKIHNNNLKLTDNSDANNDIGIYVRDFNTDTTITDTTISNNTVTGGRYGIRIELKNGGFGMLCSNNIVTDAVDGILLRGRVGATVNFKSSGNLSKGNSSNDYVYTNFNNVDACVQINDMDSNGLLPSRVTTFNADDTSPSVASSKICLTQANTVATAITQLDGGVAGQEVIIMGRSNTNSTTIADGGNFALNGAFTASNNSQLHLITHNGTTWNEISRSTN